MNCERCHAVMFSRLPIQYHADDPSTGDQDNTEKCWYCANCGNYVDSVVRANRKRQHRESSHKARIIDISKYVFLAVEKPGRRRYAA